MSRINVRICHGHFDLLDAQVITVAKSALFLAYHSNDGYRRSDGEPLPE